MAEGAGRQTGSPAEFRRYLMMAIGSADEAKLWCRYAADLGYVDEAKAAEWRDEFSHVIRMLHGLIGRVRRSSDH